ncbi:cell division ATP-binding protein FtsE [Leyella lascolaii]|uniref:ATP-binding cassette domain-containing protein n=1 Tax=Leyella lascolaii TaxID=1776379 RepID=A0AAW7JU14_9BACT|nr:ATP-binding cassette domain-containing protein [Leyella lascolaii]MDN0023005.1 ATP-binding cassette domain-containing protein [Leyella lascolaii]MDN0025291.1 ATP-binding cassette domain-containing protein [Leyella lascolaii]
MLVDYQKVNICQGGELILKDVEFSVDTDQFIYIIGKVGSGKSSLLKTMYCELDIPKQETQKAEVLGRDLLTLKRRDIPALRKEMGIIFQDFQLLHDRSVFKNLQFILHSTGWKSNKDINNRIEQVLSDVGMSDKKDKYPHELSGGEQQRIAIARAVLNTPKIIIADEPTGNLDPETANNIVELLRKITESGTSVIMSTHNISMLKKYPGIIYKCEDGSLTNITNEYYNAQKV